MERGRNLCILSGFSISAFNDAKSNHTSLLQRSRQKSCAIGAAGSLGLFCFGPCIYRASRLVRAESIAGEQHLSRELPDKFTSTISTGNSSAMAQRSLQSMRPVHRLQRGRCGLQKCRRSPTLQSRIFWSHRRAEIITSLRRQMVRSSIKTLTELGKNGKPSTTQTEGGTNQNLKTAASFFPRQGF